MPVIEDTFTASLDALTSSTAGLPRDVTAVRPLSDDELLAVERTLADARRAIDACASLVAGWQPNNANAAIRPGQATAARKCPERDMVSLLLRIDHGLGAMPGRVALDGARAGILTPGQTA